MSTFFIAATLVLAADYDPLKLPAASKSDSAPPLDLVVKDAKRDRELPIRVYLPAEKSPRPAVLF
ncbi:MAG TPA: dienelactone hydrolase, partial [Planctomycetia bacterium]|nr:dienelactone hydrolase [Planctomycetia bacterium]